jgi:hypothetical protein
MDPLNDDKTAHKAGEIIAEVLNLKPRGYTTRGGERVPLYPTAQGLKTPAGLARSLESNLTLGGLLI